MRALRALYVVCLALSLWLPGLARAEPRAEPMQAAERAVAHGDYAHALNVLEPLVKKGRPRAIALVARIHALRGERAEAERGYRTLIQRYNDDSIRDDDAEGMWAVAQAAYGLGSYRDANQAFARAVKARPDLVDIEVDWADLFLEKYDAGNAGAGLSRVLAAQPSHARALERMARVRLEDGADFADVEDLLSKALASDSELVPAYVTRAAIALRDEDLAAADRHLDQALAHNPHDLEALSVRAAVRFVADDAPGFEKAVSRVLAENPRFSRLFSIVGTYAEWEHRYDDQVALAERALRIDPDDAYAHGMRALNLLRVGREQEGLAALEQAWKRDRYNVHVFNTLNLYDDVIGKEYESFDAAPFRVRMHKEERKALEPYAVPLLMRAFADMKTRYGFTPQGPLSIELYASTEHFSVRTVGLPHIGVQGVCFGKVLTALSPRGGEFNWGQILWHELSHVFHVQASKSRIPRWFTEGLAEYETTRARPEWKREDDRALWDALQGKELPALSAMNHAFTHARRPEDLMVAYYASSVAVTYVVERFGFEVVPRMLTLWSEGLPTDQVFARALGLDLETLDRDFRAHLRQKLAPKYERDLRIDIAAYRDFGARTQQAERADASLDDRAALAMAYAVQGKSNEAESAARAVLEKDAKHPLALFALAHTSLVRGDVPSARDRLSAMIAAGHEGYQIRMLLARTQQKLGQLDAAREAALVATRLDPERGEAWELLTQIADAQKDTAGLERALERLSFLDQHARPPLARYLDLLEKRGAYAELVARAEAGLYLDPESPELHRQLALGLFETKNARAALVESERASALATSDEQKGRTSALHERIVRALQTTAKPERREKRPDSR